MKCGKQNCRCKADPPQLHGPYVQWGYSKGRRRFTRWLTPEQRGRYEPEIERGQRLMELLVELNEAEIRRVERAEGWGRKGCAAHAERQFDADSHLLALCHAQRANATASPFGAHGDTVHT